MTQNTMTLSIALCTYNGERFLREQLDSLANQTRLPDEVVVCDDGSTDETLEILEQWKKQVSFAVKIIRNTENLGINANFEKAISQCSGDVIFISDQDDIWLPEKLEKMTAVLEEKPEIGVVYCDAELVNSAGEPLHFRFGEIARVAMNTSYAMFINSDVRQYLVSGCCCCFRRELVSKILPFPRQPQDLMYDQWIYAISSFWFQKEDIEESLAYHRVHEKNATTREDHYRNYRRDVFVRRKKWYYWGRLWYYRSAEIIQIYEAKLNELVKEYPDNPRLMASLTRLGHLHTWMANRERIQRNGVIFFPIWLYEVFSLRYFRFLQPVRSMFYDLAVGVWNALNPWKMGREVKKVSEKIWQRIFS